MIFFVHVMRNVVLYFCRNKCFYKLEHELSSNKMFFRGRLGGKISFRDNMTKYFEVVSHDKIFWGVGWQKNWVAEVANLGRGEA